jgi:hypothetical protein
MIRIGLERVILIPLGGRFVGLDGGLRIILSLNDLSYLLIVPELKFAFPKAIYNLVEPGRPPPQSINHKFTQNLRYI